jgi:hypothetical protein
MRVQGMTGSRSQPKIEITQEIIMRFARATIDAAIKDYFHAEGRDRETAIMFFQSGRHFELFCEGAGVSADVLLNELGLRTEEEEE